MQRSILTSGQGSNTTYGGTGSVVTYYGPMGGPSLVNPKYTSALSSDGNGAYAQSGFAAVLSRLSFVIGGTTSTAPILTSNINIQGGTASGGTGAGNLSCTSTDSYGGNSTTPSYYYDATHFDAITAGQGVGFMQTLSALSGSVIMPSIAVACDCLDQSFSTPFLFANTAGSGTIYNGVGTFSHLAGPSSSSTIMSSQQPAQDYSAQSFVASYLQWTSGAGNTDTDAQATATFKYSSTWGGALTGASPNPLAATIGGTPGTGLYVGINYDATHICAVPAASYPLLVWSGATSSGSTLRVVNAGVHIQPAASNATWLGNGGKAASWSVSAGNTFTFATFTHTRFDGLWSEVQAIAPTAGVFSGLGVMTASYASADGTVSFNLQSAQGTGDTGAGSGGAPTFAGGFANTGVAVSFPTSSPAQSWQYDATHIAAFTASELYVLRADNSAGLTGPSTNYQATAINFAAPAHLGLGLRGAG